MYNLPAEKVSLVLVMGILFPALFINLGLPAITADEPTRAIVAMEMMDSGNYLVSTIDGGYYYKKPPLFNWILVGFYKITGSNSELVTRLAALIPLLLFALRIFLILGKRIGPKVAALTALFFLTFGRMLYYDSMLGHIDILYGWVTFESFIFLEQHYRKKKWLILFLGFYLLNAIGFMLKGLPSILFPVLTLAAMAFHQKEYKWLFSWQHITAILIASAGPFLFFYLYSQQNSLEGWVTQLWDQSKQRTVLDKTWWESVSHLFTFPLDHLMHLAPWSLLVIFIFQKGYIKQAAAHPFLRYLFWVLVFNIPVYWASPGYYPRYLFMLYPVIFVFLADAFVKQQETDNSKLILWFQRATLFIMILLTLTFVTAGIYMKWELTALSFLCTLSLMIVCIVFAVKQKKVMIWCFIAFVLTTRLAFDFYVIPYRIAHEKSYQYKNEALDIAHITKGKPLYITIPGSSIEHNYIYYIERERGDILRYHYPDTSSYFIYQPGTLENISLDTIKTFQIEYHDLTLLLVKFKSVPTEYPPLQ